MKKRLTVGIYLLRLMILASLLAGSLMFSILPAQAENSTLGSRESNQGRIDIDTLSPEEKIGQLFLVTFNGDEFGEGTRIYDLIANRHIGGVLLENRNDNFNGPENVLKSTFDLITGLQTAASEAKLAEDAKTFIPLFIAIGQNGDRAPLDEIISGMTPLPNQLALGATWNPELSEMTGSVLGSELSALGFNFYLGPSLDVLDDVQVGGSSELGAQVFGGDPYWVGLLGQAYIRGLHQGSDNKVAVIAKNFPGRGGSDRPSEEEVATVRKSLEQLKQIELAPFFAATGKH